MAAHKEDTDNLDGDNNDKFDENEDKPYEYENAGGGTAVPGELAADSLDANVSPDLNDFSKPVAVISSQQIVQIKPTKPDADKGGTASSSTIEPEYDAKNVHGHQRRRPNKKGKNSPRRRNKYDFLSFIFKYNI